MSHDDCQYWRLTPAQCLRYHTRTMRYWGDLATYHANEAARLSRRAQHLGLAALLLWLLVALLALVGAR